MLRAFTFAVSLLCFHFISWYFCALLIYFILLVMILFIYFFCLFSVYFKCLLFIKFSSEVILVGFFLVTKSVCSVIT